MTRVAVALRLARRELRRAPGRTLLTAAMVALPVLAVTTTDVLLQTELRPDDGSLALLGPVAEARLRVVQPEGAGLEQNASGSSFGSSGPGGGPVAADEQLATDEQLLEALPPGSRLAAISLGVADVSLPDGPGRVRTVLAPVADPLLAGRFQVQQGRLPATPGEVAVGPALVASGLQIGSRTTDGAGRSLTVVGVLPAGDSGSPQLLALPGATTVASVAGEGGRESLVDSPAPVTWQDVRELNRLGVVVTSRAVLRDPPQDLQIQGDGSSAGISGYGLAVAAGITAMAVLQIVLLAGPAFAVGARRQRRALAQLAAAGGRPADGRLVVLAGAGVLGVLAAALGVGAGIAVAAIARSAIDALADGPALSLPVRDLAVIFLVAVASALLAALAPARQAARQNPVAVLTDRPDPPRVSKRPLLGAVVLLALGVVGAAQGARGGNELSVAFAAVPTVLGAVLLAPAALQLAAALSRRLPFALRYPLRDAARQRSRTAPVVGAVAAVVAAAVALGIGASSDGAQYRAQDRQIATGSRSDVVTGQVPSQQVWDRLQAAAGRAAPGNVVTQVQGVSGGSLLEVCRDDGPRGDCSGPLLSGYGNDLGAGVLVGPQALSALGPVGTEAERVRAQQVLAAGGAVLLTDQPGGPAQAALRLNGKSVLTSVALLHVGAFGRAAAVLSPTVADRLGVTTTTTALAFSEPLDDDSRLAVEQALAVRAPEARLSDRAQVTDDRGTGIALLLLGAVAGLLVLGGALTSTLLALADARPELATLSTLGATAATSRAVAASYAATIGLVGTVLGAAAGLVPGIAVAYPLTRDGNGQSGLLPNYLDIPWLLLAGLVVGVPLLTGLVAALTRRGPLPTRGRTALA